MFMISNEAMRSVVSLREKIADPERRTECITELESMIKTKESHLARAEWSSCCGNIRGLAHQIDGELRILQSTLEALKKIDNGTAASLLEEYISLLRKNYTPEPERL